MLGQEVPIGTGSVELLFDEERYSDLAADVELEEQKRPSNSYDNTHSRAWLRMQNFWSICAHPKCSKTHYLTIYKML